MTDTPSPRATPHPLREGDPATRPMDRRMPVVGSLLLAAVAYVPLLLTAPGEVGADKPDGRVFLWALEALDVAHHVLLSHGLAARAIREAVKLAQGAGLCVELFSQF